MQNIVSPSPAYQGCTVRGLPISIPFRIAYDDQGGGKQIGKFVILPYKISAPGIRLLDFAMESLYRNTSSCKSLLNHQTVVNAPIAPVTDTTAVKKNVSLVHPQSNTNVHPDIKTHNTDLNTGDLSIANHTLPVLAQKKPCNIDRDGTSYNVDVQAGSYLPQQNKPRHVLTKTVHIVTTGTENRIAANKACYANQDRKTYNIAVQVGGYHSRLKKQNECIDRRKTTAKEPDNNLKKSSKITDSPADSKDVISGVRIKTESETDKHGNFSSILNVSEKVDAGYDQSALYGIDKRTAHSESEAWSTMVVVGLKTETNPDGVMYAINREIGKKSDCAIKSTEKDNYQAENLCTDVTYQSTDLVQTICTDEIKTEMVTGENEEVVSAPIFEMNGKQSRGVNTDVLEQETLKVVRREGEDVNKGSQYSDENPFEINTSVHIKQKNYRRKSKKKKSVMNTNERLEDTPAVTRKRKQYESENSELSKVLKLKMVKIDGEDGEVNVGARRQSTRLRSIGFRPDYENVENKIDEVLEHLGEDIRGEDNEEENLVNEITSIVDDIYDPADDYDTVNSDNDNCMTRKKPTKKHEQNCKGDKDTCSVEKDPDFDPDTCIFIGKKKSTKAGVENESSDLSYSDECEELCSNESDQELPITRKKVVKEAKKQKPKKRIVIKLNEHKDKYTIDTIASIARKDRGKSEKERSEVVFACSLCSKYKSESEEGMEIHLEQHINGDLDCSLCDFSASIISDLRNHKLDVHKKNPRICPKCGIAFSADLFKNHMGKVHNIPQYECAYCIKTEGQTTWHITGREFRKHMRDKHRDVGFSCKHCNNFFRKKTLWVQHEITCLGKDGPQCCDKCGLKLASSVSLMSHMNRVHLNIRKFQCPECPFTSVNGTGLKYHKLVHQGVHPYSCDECDFTCIQPYQLTSHMRTHTGEKPYKCNQCKYAAAWNVQLKDHVKVHFMGPATIMCQQCDILFKNEKTLNIHVKKIHNTDSKN